MTIETTTITVDGPLDLRATLRPITSVWGRWTPDGWVRPVRTPDGPATVVVTRDSEGIHARAWGDGSGWMLARLADWVGGSDDPRSFQTDHPLVARLHRRHRGARFARTSLVLESAVAAIVTQKVTGAEAKRGLRGLQRRFSEPAPGPFDGLRLPPDPGRLAAAPYHEFHDLGIERRRADTVRRLARDGHRIDRLASASADEATTYLLRYPGVGVWTAAETVALSHGDTDALSVGDFHLKHHAAWHLAGRPRGTDEEMVELLEPFRPHRARVIRLLERAGGYPRYGPRMPIRSFAGY